MSRDGYITHGNLGQYQNPMQAEPKEAQQDNELRMENKQQSEEWQAYQKLQTETDTLTKNRRTTLFGSGYKEDSRQMKDVKRDLGDITKFYMETTIPASEEEFREQLTKLQGMYQELKKHCNIYLNDKRGGWKRYFRVEGSYRYELVQKALTKASVELAILESRAKHVYSEFANVEDINERPLWVNVLAQARTKYLDLGKNKDDGSKVEYTSGNTNSVIKLTTKSGKVGYIKETEKNILPIQCTDRFLENLYASEHGKQAMEDGVTKEQLARFVNMLLDAFENSRVFKKTYLKDKNFNAPNFREEKNRQGILKNLKICTSKEKYEDMEDFFERSYAKDIAGEYGEFYFMRYMSASIAIGRCKIEENADITKRNVATYRLAELLGVPELIPASSNVKYKDVNGVSHEGILMSEAKGDEMWKANHKVWDTQNKLSIKDKVVYSNKIYMQLNSLQLLDIISGQMDRHKSNIMMEYDGNQIVNIKGIDNDMAFGNMSYQEVQEILKEKKNASLKPIQNSNGKLKLKLIDKRMYQALISLTDEMVEYVFADILSRTELNALLDRLHGVVSLFDHITEKDGIYVIDEKDVSAKHVKEVRDKQSDCYSGLLV